MVMQGQNIVTQIRTFFARQPLLGGIIGANVIMGFLVLILQLMGIGYSYGMLRGYSVGYDIFGIPSGLHQLATRPWSVLTYMFVHSSFLQMAINMLMLYGIGMMCIGWLGNRRFAWTYFLGGIAGGLVYSCFGVSGVPMMGSSAALIAVFVLLAVSFPNQKVQLWPFQGFTLSLWVVALLFLGVDLLFCSSAGNNGYIVRVAGAGVGFFFAWVYPRLKPISAGGRASGNRSRMRVSSKNKAPRRPLSDEEYNANRAQNQKQVDAILDKISQKGYDSLTRKEKEFLFRYKG